MTKSIFSFAFACSVMKISTRPSGSRIRRLRQGDTRRSLVEERWTGQSYPTVRGFSRTRVRRADRRGAGGQWARAAGREGDRIRFQAANGAGKSLPRTQGAGQVLLTRAFEQGITCPELGDPLRRPTLARNHRSRQVSLLGHDDELAECLELRPRGCETGHTVLDEDRAAEQGAVMQVEANRPAPVAQQPRSECAVSISTDWYRPTASSPARACRSCSRSGTPPRVFRGSALEEISDLDIPVRLG